MKLEIKDLHASVEGKEILKGVNLTWVRARLTPSWAPTGQARAPSLTH